MTNLHGNGGQRAHPILRWVWIFLIVWIRGGRCGGCGVDVDGCGIVSFIGYIVQSNLEMGMGVSNGMN